MPGLLNTMKLVFIFIIAIFVLSCTSNNKNKNSRNDSAVVVNPGQDDKDTSDQSTRTSGTRPIQGIEGCYVKVLKRDTFVLRITNSQGELIGKLAFNNFQKDKSTGSVRGKLEGNIIKLWYDFQSEGMHSVMQVFFKKEGDELIRGFGPVEVRGDSSYFKDPVHIQYDPEQTFKRSDCSTLPSKY